MSKQAVIACFWFTPSSPWFKPHFMISSWRRKLWGLSVLARHGKPSTVLSFRGGLGGLGDQLFSPLWQGSFVKRGKPRVWVSTYAPDFFAGMRHSKSGLVPTQMTTSVGSLPDSEGRHDQPDLRVSHS